MVLARRAWSDIPVTANWAEQVFKAALLNSEITALDISKLHEFLVEQFAFNDFIGSTEPGASSVIKPVKPYAIWCLCSNLQALAQRLSRSKTHFFEGFRDADFTGLSEHTGAAVGELLKTSGVALARLQNSKNVRHSLTEFLAALTRLLSHDGITSWIACRCAVVLLEASQSLYYRSVGGDRYVAGTDSPLKHVEEWGKLRRRLPAFFRSAMPQDSDSAGRTRVTKIVRLGLHKTCPSHVVIDGALASVPLLLSEAYSTAKKLRFEWLQRVPIPRYWVSDLIAADRTLSVMKLITERSINWHGPKPELDRETTRRIAAAIRNSNDKAFLVGAFFTLIGAKFWNVVGLAKLRKIIDADQESLGITPALFDVRGREKGEPPSQRAVRLADLIVRQKIKTTKATSTAACKFLLDYSAVELPPLRSLAIFPKTAITPNGPRA
jgi:hypothetical protein